MKRATFVNRTWMSMVGVATAVTTTAATWAPVTGAAPTADLRDTAVSAEGADAADGTYESCAAYFGYGKGEYGVLDIVDFDVADENPTDGMDHAVGDDTRVILELTNADGDTLECEPVEVTEAMWDDAMDEIGNNLPVSDAVLPAWPGAGHYIYPTVTFEPYIDDFGMVTGVGFKVVSIPDGHTLVSPAGVQPLDMHYPMGADISYADDPLVAAYIDSEAGPAARAAYEDALSGCRADETVDPIMDADLVAARNALMELIGASHRYEVGSESPCWELGADNSLGSFVLNLDAAADYTEAITLSTPESTTTSTPAPTTTPATTTRVPAEQPEARAATPVSATPSYTG